MATASKREKRAVISGASARSSSASSRSTPATAATAAFSWRVASMRQARRSSWPAARGARSGASAGGDASAAWSPATRIPRSSAMSVSASRSGGRRPGDERGEAFGRRLVGVLAAGHEGLEHRDGGDARVARHDLGRAGEARHAGERRLLRQVRGQLEVGVEAGLDPAIGLEQQPFAEDHRRVRLVAAERSLIGRGDGSGRGVVPQVGQAGRRRADQRRRRSRGLAVARHRREGPAVRDRRGQRAPGPVALDGRAQPAAGRVERHRVPVRPVADTQVDEREHRGVRQREGVRDAAPRSASSPSRRTSARRRSSPDRGRGPPPRRPRGRSSPRRPGPSDAPAAPGSGRQMPVLIVMCLTVV